MSLRARFELDKGGFRLAAELAEPESGITALFGPSGCGKSTLLRCLAGLERPRGDCSLGGEIWQDDARGLFVAPHRRGIGMVFQDARLFPHLTVAGNLRYAADRGGGDWRDGIELMGLEALLSRQPASLSGGERQRVAIARALLSRPRLLLLDEPLSAVDAARKADILPYLERLQTELRLPALYVTHSLDEVVRLAERVVLMDAGRTLAAGPTAQMLTRLDLPLARREDAGALLRARVAGHEDAFHLSELRIDALSLRIPRLDLVVGSEVRLRIQARDVSLTLDPPGRTSILNVLPARVIDIGDAGPGQRLVTLALGDQTLLARISARSQVELELTAGAAVFAQVKGVALA